MTIYFAPIARLLGDLVVCLQPLQQLIADGEDVHLIARSASQLGLVESIPGLAGHIAEPLFLERNCTEKSVTAFKELIGVQGVKPYKQDRVINFREHPLQTDFVWGSPEFNSNFPQYRISRVIAEISDCFGIKYDTDRFRPLAARINLELQNTIILIPGTASPIKAWPTSSWQSLYGTLRASAFPCVLIGEPDKSAQVRELIDFGIPYLPTPTLADAISAVSSCERVISVDTGLMHIAAHQGANTIALFRDDAFFARELGHVQNLFAEPCVQECREQEFVYTPNSSLFYSAWENEKSTAFWSQMRCRNGKSNTCMSSISVESVLALLERRRVLA